MVKWWDRFWGAVWMLGSVAAAYLTGRWFASYQALDTLGGLRYGLIAFAGLFGLLVGAFCLSLAVIGITSGVEYLLARAGHPLRPPRPAPDAAETSDDSSTPAAPDTAMEDRVEATALPDPASSATR